MPRYPTGQPVRLSTTVRDAAGTLVTPGVISLTLLRPDASLAVFAAPTSTGIGQYRQDLSAADLAQVGDYLYEWVTAGTGAGVAAGGFTVFAPLAVGVYPTRPQVAKYVPQRTIPADQSSDLPGLDFGPLTTPTADQADDHIAAAVLWVTARAGTVAAGLRAAAADVAAVRAAGMIELAYPVRDADINTAEQLLAQADQMLAALVEANEDAGGDGDVPGHVLSAWVFPDPEPWGDVLIWG